MSNVQLIKGDCIEEMRKISDCSIDLIATDPPYKTTARGIACGGGMLQTDLFKKGKVFTHNEVVPQQYATQFYRVLKNGSHCYVMTNHVNLIEMLNEFTKSGFHFIKSLIWNKGNKIMGQFYMSQFEYILFFRKGSAKKINNCGTSDILNVLNKKTKDANGKNLHDTEKPIELMKILVENSSNAGSTVLDPFMGIGSTGVACVNTNRDFIGIELDDHYFEIAQSRIKEAEAKNN